MVLTESLPISSLVLDSQSQMALWAIADRLRFRVERYGSLWWICEESVQFLRNPHE